MGDSLVIKGTPIYTDQKVSGWASLTVCPGGVPQTRLSVLRYLCLLGHLLNLFSSAPEHV